MYYIVTSQNRVLFSSCDIERIVEYLRTCCHYYKGNFYSGRKKLNIRCSASDFVLIFLTAQEFG